MPKHIPPKTHRHPKRHFLWFLIWFSVSSVSGWRTDGMKCVWAHPCRTTCCTRGRKNITLTDTESITQRRLNGLDLSVIKHSQISVGELFNPDRPPSSTEEHAQNSPDHGNPPNDDRGALRRKASWARRPYRDTHTQEHPRTLKQTLLSTDRQTSLFTIIHWVRWMHTHPKTPETHRG